MGLVVDASVAIKWLVEEDHSDAARRIAVSQSRLIAPDLIWLEVGNALIKKQRRRLLLAATVRELVRDLRFMAPEIVPSAPLVDQAVDLAQDHRLSLYDGIYLAAAIGRQATVVTADRKFHDAIKRGALGDRIVWVEDAA